jgi:hypothetical protein
MMAFMFKISSSQLSFLEELKQNLNLPYDSTEIKNEINSLLLEIQKVTSLEINPIANENEIIIRKDLLAKLQKLDRKKLWAVVYGLESQFEKDKKKAEENIKKKEKESIIDYLRHKYHDKKELRDLLKHLEEKSLEDLRQIARDLEYRYEPDPQRAEKNLKKAERRYIILYIDGKYHEDKKKTEKYLEDALKDELSIGGISGEGIHDYIYDMDKKKLIDVSMALEFYHRKATGDQLKENFYQQLQRMDEHDLRSNIIREVEEHPEINNWLKIEEILFQYSNEPKKPLEGLEAFLVSLDREKLVKLAFDAEKIHKKSHGGEHSIGGLHDYIWKMSEEEIRVYILKEVIEHPQEFSSLEAIKKMVHNN